MGMASMAMQELIVTLSRILLKTDRYQEILVSHGGWLKADIRQYSEANLGHRNPDIMPVC